jgi:carboxypeptidase A2
MKVLAALFLAVAAVGAMRYDGYRVVDVGPLKDDREVKIIMGLVDDDERIRQVIMLGDSIAKVAPVSLAVSPVVWDRVQQIFDEEGIHFVILNNDMQASFDDAKKDNDERLAKISKQFKDDPTQFDHTAYLRYADQQAWLSAAAAASNIASTFTIGQSFGGRTITGISINAGTNLPGIWIDSNIHAREWISSATTLYIIDQILTGTSADAQYLRTSFRWYIVPNLNPDGYEHCHTADRLWRKTRSTNAGSACIGTDPNRNWDSNFGGEGASPSPCSDTYHGTRAFSEAETAAARDYINSIRSFTNIFISIHCYSNFWLVPWGGRTAKPADYSELLRVGNAAAAAIRGVNGLNFAVGTPPDLLYVASGGSFDWAKETAGIKYSYSPELRPATAGQGGFEIPPSNIIPSGNEIFASFVAVARQAAPKEF